MKRPFDVTSLENDSDLDTSLKKKKSRVNEEEIHELEDFYNQIKKKGN